MLWVAMILVVHLPLAIIAPAQVRPTEDTVTYARRRVREAPERSVCSQQEKNVVPMRGSRLLPLIEVKINGRGPYRLLFDTGANVTVLQMKVADELNLPVLRDGEKSRLVAIEKIQIGETTFEGIVAGARAWKEEIDGVLGFNVAAECLLTFDYPKQSFEFARGMITADNARTIFSYVEQDGSPYLQGRIGNLAVKFLIDSGANDAFLFSADYKAKLKFKGDLQLGRTLTNMDVQGESIVGRSAKDVRIGKSLTVQKPLIQLDTAGTVDPGYAHIGSKVWQFFRLTFDQKTRRVEISGARYKITPADLEDSK